MFGNLWRVPTHAQALGAFAVRGRAIRTFASLTLVLTVGLLFLGVYLIAIDRPVHRRFRSSHRYDLANRLDAAFP
jgi:hypothetical protein